MTDATATGIAVLLLLVCGLYWKLVEIPTRLWAIARDALVRAHVEADVAAQKALREAVEAKAAALLSSVRVYQNQLAADYRKQVAEAELKVRVAERHATDTGTALETATALVRELRTTIDALGGLPALLRDLQALRAGGADTAPETRAATEPDDSRKTIEIEPPAVGFEPDRWSDPTTVFDAAAAPATPGARGHDAQV